MLRVRTGNPIIVVVFALGIFMTGKPVTLCLASYNAGVPGPQLFHKGGTGNCDGCHLIHNSDEAGEINDNPSQANKNLHRLKGSDPSSTCLNCHQASLDNPLSQQHYIATNPIQMAQGMPPRELSPGGDFGWLKKNYKWGNNERSQGERHGHNIVAQDYSYSSDTTITTSPGGDYLSANLSCISCHDPHGNYRRFMDGTVGNNGLPVAASGSYNNSPDPNAGSSVGTYRLLAGKGYQAKNAVGGSPFTADPPAAVAPVNYNRSESSADTRVAYGSGMSEWCGNCHARIHNDGNNGARRHPAGNSAKLSLETITNYNSYIASGNLNGNSSVAYSSMVPFEMGTNDYTTLKATANSNGADRSGPGTEANVMCLTCHRAHASGWDSMTRWNMQGEFIVYNGRYPGVDNGAPADFSQGRSSAEVQKTFYDRPARLYASYQRSLCNKCHAKD